MFGDFSPSDTICLFPPDEGPAVGPGAAADSFQHPAEGRAKSAAGEGPVQHLRPACQHQGGRQLFGVFGAWVKGLLLFPLSFFASLLTKLQIVMLGLETS